MDYAAALAYMEGVSWLGSRPGLERIARLMARLGSPQDSLRFVHVAGTNGKGSVSHILASILQRHEAIHQPDAVRTLRIKEHMHGFLDAGNQL